MKTIKGVRYQNIPKDLRVVPNWIVWRYETVTQANGKNKKTKVPYSVDGHRASSTDSAHWSDLKSALRTLRDGDYSGIGFVFDRKSGFVGVDIDHCIDEHGNLDHQAKVALSTLRSYSEVSPSGSGLHIIVKGELPGPGRCDHKTGHEMYMEGRFFTVTGEVFGDLYTISENQDSINKLYESWFGSVSYQEYETGEFEFDKSARILKLSEMPISDETKVLIRSGKGMSQYKGVDNNEDRSLALFAVCREMVYQGVNKESILACLTNKSNYLSSAALDRRPNRRSAMEWLWKYTLGKIIARYNEEREMFDEIEGDDDQIEPDTNTSGVVEVKSEREVDPRSIPFDKSDHERNALLFLKMVKPVVRARKQDYIFNGKYWKVLEDEELEALIQKTIQGHNLSMGCVNNTITTIRRYSMRRDFSPDKNIVVLRNGVLDLTGWDNGDVDLTLKPHSKKYRVTSILDYDYDPAAKAPVWSRFLDEVSCGDEEWIRCLKMYMGYLLVWDYRFHKILNLVGQSRSGKGTILNNVIPLITGWDAFRSTTLSNLSSDFGLESLVHTKCAVITDAHHGRKDRINRAKEVLLSISGNDFVPVNRKHKGEITIQIPARLIMASNEMPRFSDGMDAVYNRYLILPFRKSFAGNEDTALGQKLRSEASGILNFAIDGLIDLGRTGYIIEPESNADLKDELMMGQNPVGYFVKHYITRTGSERDSVSMKELYEHFILFSESIGAKLIDEKWFGRKLKDLFPWIDEHKARVRGKNGEFVRGLKGVLFDRKSLIDFVNDT